MPAEALLQGESCNGARAVPARSGSERPRKFEVREASVRADVLRAGTARGPRYGGMPEVRRGRIQALLFAAL
jgi:hypothetical protein